MDREKQRQIASKGGRAAHAKGTAHQFTPEEARAAGRKGGQAAHAKGTAHQFTPEEARVAGRKGGQAAHGGPSRGDRDNRQAGMTAPPQPMTPEPTGEERTEQCPASYTAPAHETEAGRNVNAPDRTPETTAV